MKLLFHENLSPKLPHLFAAQFPGSAHVRECALKGHTDEEIWDYASANGFTIISKDSDFSQRSLLSGTTAKVIWLRIGNCTREDLTALLHAHVQEIQAFVLDSTQCVLILQ